MRALIASAPLLLRRRGALADLLPVIAFAAATGILLTVLGGVGGFAGRMSAASDAAAAGVDQSEETSILSFFLICAIIAATLLVPSALGLGGAAARLSLARREQDLAAMRLVGGTTAQVGTVAVVDVIVQALAGGVVGLVLHLAVTPLMTTLDFGIAPFTAGELLLPGWGYPLVLLGVVILAAGSASVALLGVALTPLGVARQSRTVRMSIVRVILWGALVLGFFVAARSTGQLSMIGGDAMVVAVLVAMMALVMLSLGIIGPFLVWVAARLVAVIARGPALLVGARRLAADPRAGWRSVSGITVALVIAGFLGFIQVISEPSNPEEVRLMAGLHTGGLLTLAIAAVLAAVSTGVTQAARAVDQAPVLRAQHISGAEVRQLHAARWMEIAIPLALSTMVAVSTALLLLTPAIGEVAANPLPLALQLLVCAAVAYGLVAAAVVASAPIVRRGALAGT